MINVWYILCNGVLNFENMFATYCEPQYVVGVANSLDAIGLGLVALNLPPKSEGIIIHISGNYNLNVVEDFAQVHWAMFQNI